MQRPYDISRMYKYLLKKYLKKEIEMLQEVKPENCIYHRVISIGEGIRIGICNFDNQTSIKLYDPNVVICEKCEHAKQCSAFAPIYPTEVEASTHLAEVLKDPKVKKSKFPDLLILEWVMANDLHHMKETPKGIKQKFFNIFLKFMYKFLYILENIYKKL